MLCKHNSFGVGSANPSRLLGAVHVLRYRERAELVVLSEALVILRSGGDRAHVTALLRGMTWVCEDRKGHRAAVLEPSAQDRLAVQRIGWRRGG